ncbi:uncharacterized protein LOC129601818 isoform X1 [Paramacrobiotus metropolitanus]|uniref:uncharacterized protein LOC129601818 isoform X1 n=1 Tax=Paramacrobiotus metropolitanus TaxID=2943436 RepID=UPI00244654AD|nr:uncharacterized protein LOC129601818 isoform X1 [Paramacrobiotus metropolitanus]
MAHRLRFSPSSLHNVPLLVVCIFVLIDIPQTSADDVVDEKFIRNLSSLYMACNSPCDPDVLALKLSAYLRFMNSKRSAFLEDERNKFAEEAPWYLGKRSARSSSTSSSSSSGLSSFIDYPTSYGWRVGKRTGLPEWGDAGTVLTDGESDDDVVTVPRIAGSGTYSRAVFGPAAIWLMQPRALRAEKWRSLMNQPW